MYFVIIGLILIVLNVAGIGPVGNWTWNLTGDLWKFAAPFVLAVIWWAWADKSGLNKRREIEKMEAKKQGRRKENLAALGLDSRAKRKGRDAG
jgi:small Trp-rich protein